MSASGAPEQGETREIYLYSTMQQEGDSKFFSKKIKALKQVLQLNKVKHTERKSQSAVKVKSVD